MTAHPNPHRASPQIAIRLCLMVAIALASSLPAQQRNMKADALSPFRNPDQDYAPPDAIYAALRTMRAVAEGAGKDKCTVADEGYIVCDHPEWRAAFRRLEKAKIRGYEGYLARIMRHSNSVLDRDLAFYGAMYGDDPAKVLELIAHIPGEPDVKVREQALVRAIPYLRANLGRTFGELPEEQQEAMRSSRPAMGSPAARSQGLTELTDETWLYGFNAKPFAELLLVPDTAGDPTRPLARAQGWWFFKEMAYARRDLLDQWMTPMVHNIREATTSDSAVERQQVFGLIAALDPERRPPPPLDARGPAVTAWVDDVLERIYPPIRQVSEGLVEIYDGAQRRKLISVGKDLLERSGLGADATGQYENGDYYRGIKITSLPEPLNKLGIPLGAVLTTINGQGVSTESEVLTLITRLIEGGAPTLMLEFARNGKAHAVEYRIL